MLLPDNVIDVTDRESRCDNTPNINVDYAQFHTFVCLTTHIFLADDCKIQICQNIS